MKFTIKRKSTSESNISDRTVWYDIMFGDEYVTSIWDIIDAQDYIAELNAEFAANE